MRKRKPSRTIPSSSWRGLFSSERSSRKYIRAYLGASHDGTVIAATKKAASGNEIRQQTFIGIEASAQILSRPGVDIEGRRPGCNHFARFRADKGRGRFPQTLGDVEPGDLAIETPLDALRFPCADCRGRSGVFQSLNMIGPGGSGWRKSCSATFVVGCWPGCK